jgi:hypothetical protein
VTPLELPIQVPGGAEVLTLLERIAAAVEDTGDKSAEASQKTATGFERAQERIAAAANAFNETREAVSGFAEMVGAMAERLVTSASGAERLERAQQQLGLSFEQAAEAAGGYVDQVQVATAAQTLAERGIRLTQQELNGLSRVAQNYARTTGREFGEAMEQVTEVVTEGGEEMGKLDTALLRVADTARFTADDRLRALVDRAQQLPPGAGLVLADHDASIAVAAEHDAPEPLLARHGALTSSRGTQRLAIQRRSDSSQNAVTSSARSACSIASSASSRYSAACHAL